MPGYRNEFFNANTSVTGPGVIGSATRSGSGGVSSGPGGNPPVQVIDPVPSALLATEALEADKLTTPRTFTFTGDVTGGPTSFDGSTNVSTALTLAHSTTIFSQTSSVTVANTVTETNLNGTGVGSLTLPAAYLTPGRTIKLTAIGVHSATGNPTIQLRAYLGNTVVLDTTAVTSGNGTNNTWDVRGFIVCRTTGVSGTVDGQGFYVESGGGANIFGMANTSTVTIDTTASQTLKLTVQWGTAALGNTITCPILFVESVFPISL